MAPAAPAVTGGEGCRRHAGRVRRGHPGVRTRRARSRPATTGVAAWLTARRYGGRSSWAEPIGARGASGPQDLPRWQRPGFDSPPRPPGEAPGSGGIAFRGKVARGGSPSPARRPARAHVGRPGPPSPYTRYARRTGWVRLGGVAAPAPGGCGRSRSSDPRTPGVASGPLRASVRRKAGQAMWPKPNP